MLCETVRLTPRWRACRPFHNGNFQGSTSGEALQDYWMAGSNHTPACHFVEMHRDCAGLCLSVREPECHPRAGSMDSPYYNCGGMKAPTVHFL